MTLQLSLHPQGRGIVLLTAVALLGTYWIAETVRIALVETWSESSDPKDVERARALDQNNPELSYRTGTLYLLGVGGDSADPLPWLRKATELNPKRGKYWLGLERACFVAGDQGCADHALARAMKLSPMTPSTEWEAASYYVLTGRWDDSFAYFRWLLHFDPDRESEIFRFTSRAFDPSTTWQKVIAILPDTRVKCDYLAFLSENGQFDIAREHWAQTAASSPAPSFEDVKSYLQDLLRAQRYGEAANLWRDLLRLGTIGQTDGDDKNNLVFNGSFERPVLNAGFDWHPVLAGFVAVDFSDHTAHTGKYALRVDYTVPQNGEGEAAYELIPVAPNQKYVLTAYSRSHDLTSNSGPRLRVQDAKCPECLDVTTDTTVGTTPWHQLKLSFSTGPKAEVLRLSVWRSRGRTFPMDISGSFWLDSVSLTAAGPSMPGGIGDANVAASNLP
jgi:hypothetical protein